MALLNLWFHFKNSLKRISSELYQDYFVPLAVAIWLMKKKREREYEKRKEKERERGKYQKETESETEKRYIQKEYVGSLT